MLWFWRDEKHGWDQPGFFLRITRNSSSSAPVSSFEAEVLTIPALPFWLKGRVRR